MRNRTITQGVLCCIVLLLAACGGTTTPTPAPSPDNQPTGTGEYVPIAEAECTALRQSLAVVLGVEVDQGTSPFEDYAVGGRGTGCLLKATGTGVNFPSIIGLVSDIQFMLEDMGYVLDIRYAADGPTGTAFALRQDIRLVLVGVMWTPSADANCPQDKPITECGLKPEQMLYTIPVRAAQK